MFRPVVTFKKFNFACAKWVHPLDEYIICSNMMFTFLILRLDSTANQLSVIKFSSGQLLISKCCNDAISVTAAYQYSRFSVSSC